MKLIAVFDIENDRIFDYSCDLHVWNEFGDVRLVKENVLLRELPRRATADNDFAKGWNWCLDEIAGVNE